jgi:hypothetical protein
MMNMAKLVWTFDISSPSPETVSTCVETAFAERAAIAPLRFPVQFKPRSEKHVEVVEREFGQAEVFMSRYH